MKTKLVAQLMQTVTMADEEMVKFLATVPRNTAAELYSAAGEVDYWIQKNPEAYSEQVRRGIWLMELNAKARWDNHIKDAVTV